jgi:enoyl-CoA hydratase
MTQEIIAQQDGPILRITLNRPEQGNGISDGMARELTRLLGSAAETSHLVVLRGAGADFCTGRAAPPPGAPPRPREALETRRYFDVVFDCYGAFRSCPVPIIGVVQGRALGAGCALAALCDITIASEASRFQVPEMAHSILPTMVASSFVDRVPLKALTYLVYSTAVIGPERALSFGIVSEIVPAAGLDDAVAALCAGMLKAPLPALLAVKEFARSAPKMDVQGAVDFARNLHAVVNSSSELRRK